MTGFSIKITNRHGHEATSGKNEATPTSDASEEDLLVVDWNSALVFDASGAPEVADVLEFALTHLMEFRSFDDILDQRLERLYSDVERRRPSLFYRGFERLSRDANALYLEFADYVERVENSVKFVGDPYLATIFGAAVSRSPEVGRERRAEAHRPGPHLGAAAGRGQRPPQPFPGDHYHRPDPVRDHRPGSQKLKITSDSILSRSQ